MVIEGTGGKIQALSIPAQSSDSANATSQKLDKLIAGGSPDYDSWRSLILEIETQSPEEMDTISLAYDSFLSAFPLCHWHLKKCAQHKAKLCGPQEAVNIYERTVGVSMYSVGFWVDYFAFGAASFGNPEDVRRLFRRAISFVDRDYFSHVLWDNYMKYEFDQQGWSFLAHGYIQTLRFPTMKLQFYYNNFKLFITNLEEEMGYENNNGIIEQFSVPCTSTEISTDEVSLTIKDLLDSPDRLVKSKALDKYKSIGEGFYREARQVDNRIKCFEKKIHRRYFYSTPLDDDEINNWHQYLDFIEKQGNMNWAMKLYERCLIPCAHYPEFWMRYVEFLESNGGRELAISALDRSTQIFLKNVPEIHLFKSRFKELLGDVSESPLHGRSAYKKENGSGPHTSSVSSVSGNNRSRGHPSLIDDAPAGFYFMDFIQFRFFIFKFTRVKKTIDMELVRMVVECVSFVCNFEFWRMAVLWTLSLVFSYFKLFFQRICSSESKYYHRFSPAEYAFPNSSTPMPVCVITGASSGLGAAAAYALSMEGFYVVLVGRSSENLSKAISDVKSRNHDACLKAFEVDLSSFKSIHEFKDSLQQWLLDSKMHSSIQLLVNNAGIFATSRRFTSDGYDQMLATNYIGPVCLTKLLLPLLENSPVPSRVINVTSFTHRNICCMQADRETVSGMCFTKSKCYPYAHIYEYSKLCLLLFSYELHRQAGLTEKSRHVSVVAVDPGAVKTNIMREVPPCVSRVAFIGLKLLGLLQCPETGVSSIVDAALASPEVSGVYFFGGKGRCLNSSALSYDSRLAKDLWATSCNLFQEMQAET